MDSITFIGIQLKRFRCLLLLVLGVYTNKSLLLPRADDQQASERPPPLRCSRRRHGRAAIKN